MSYQLMEIKILFKNYTFAFNSLRTKIIQGTDGSAHLIVKTDGNQLGIEFSFHAMKSCQPLQHHCAIPHINDIGLCFV
jgi:hypothetical protein